MPKMLVLETPISEVLFLLKRRLHFSLHPADALSFNDHWITHKLQETPWPLICYTVKPLSLFRDRSWALRLINFSDSTVRWLFDVSGSSLNVRFLVLYEDCGHLCIGKQHCATKFKVSVILICTEKEEKCIIDLNRRNVSPSEPKRESLLPCYAIIQGEIHNRKSKKKKKRRLLFFYLYSPQKTKMQSCNKMCWILKSHFFTSTPTRKALLNAITAQSHMGEVQRHSGKRQNSHRFLKCGVLSAVWGILCIKK